MTPKRLAAISQGYVGLPSSMSALDFGYSVIRLAADERRIKTLSDGSSYVEDVSAEVVQSGLETGRFLPTTSTDNLAGLDFAIITIPTRLCDTLSALTFIEIAHASRSKCPKPGATVVLDSTTHPGTTEGLMVPILEEGSGLKATIDFHVGYSPERIDLGSAPYCFVTTPKVVAGLGEAGRVEVEELYTSPVDTSVPVSTQVKHHSPFFLAMVMNAVRSYVPRCSFAFLWPMDSVEDPSRMGIAS